MPVSYYYLSLEVNMWCVQCSKHLSQCNCPDLQDRLKSLGEHVIYRKCLICDQHYSKCKCENPNWGTNKTTNMTQAEA